MKLSLIVQTEGKMQGKALDINLAQFVIGRDPQCHLRPGSALISKRHCAILRRGGKAYLRDFDSTNGTILNDQPVKGEVELQDGDMLRVGPLHFVVRLEEQAAVDKPTPMPAGVKAATPAPMPAPSSADSGSSDDEIAALLLGEPFGGDAGDATAASDVPEGSTVLDMKAIEKSQAAGGDASKGAPKKDEKKSSGDTRSAADAILKKYMRRPRT